MTTGSLYLIPVPLGEGGDIASVIPEQARRLAASLKTFVVEHPKSARQFLKLNGTALPLQEIRMLTLDEHTRPGDLEALLQPLLDGEDVGLLSEAGCPAVADPGANLVRLAHTRNIRVIPLVGPSSILLALMASGLNGQSFAFLGYLPAEKIERVKRISEIEQTSQRLNQAQIFIETPYRNNQLLLDLVQTCDGETELCVASDLTLPSETVMTKCIREWKKELPDYGKRPTVFLLYRRPTLSRNAAPRQKR